MFGIRVYIYFYFVPVFIVTETAVLAKWIERAPVIFDDFDPFSVEWSKGKIGQLFIETAPLNDFMHRRHLFDNFRVWRRKFPLGKIQTKTRCGDGITLMVGGWEDWCWERETKTRGGGIAWTWNRCICHNHWHVICNFRNKHPTYIRSLDSPKWMRAADATKQESLDCIIFPGWDFQFRHTLRTNACIAKLAEL